MSERFQDRYRISSARASWWDYGRNAAYFVAICTAGRDYYFGNIADLMQTGETLHIVERLHETSLQIKNVLSPIGEIAQSCWSEIPQHFPYAQLDSFVVMPNHVHGILIIDKRIGMIIKNEVNSEMENGMGELTNDRTFNPMINLTNAIIENANDKPLELSTDVPLELSTDDLPLETNVDLPLETRLIASLHHGETMHPYQTIQNCQSFENTKPQKLIGGITGDNNPMLHENLSRIVRWYKGRTAFESHKINPSFAWQTRFYETIVRDEQTYKIVSDYIFNNPSKWRNDQFYIN